MKGFRFVLIAACCGMMLSAQGQQAFNNCAAAFLEGNMIVDAYTDTGKCSLPMNASGKLSVATVELSDKGGRLMDKIAFKIAIRDGNTKTLLLFGDATHKEVDIQKVLAQCKKGDSIVLLTLDNPYALPHNEIYLR